MPVVLMSLSLAFVSSGFRACASGGLCVSQGGNADLGASEMVDDLFLVVFEHKVVDFGAQILFG